MITTTSKGRFLRLAITAILAAASATPTLAQEASDAPATVLSLDKNPVVSADAQAVLDRMQSTFATLKSYSVTTQVTRDEMLAFGYKLQNTESATLWVQAPNRLRVEVKGDMKNRTYVYDGTSLTTFSPDENLYATGVAPDKLGDLVNNLLEAGVEMPLIDLLYSGFTGDLTSDVRVGLVVGESIVDGVATDHLAFRQPNVDWQLWVEKGPRALPRKLVITTRYQLGDPQYQALMQWNTKPEFNAKTFTFTPPAGSLKVPMRTNLTSTEGAK